MSWVCPVCGGPLDKVFCRKTGRLLHYWCHDCGPKEISAVDGRDHCKEFKEASDAFWAEVARALKLDKLCGWLEKKLRRYLP